VRPVRKAFARRHAGTAIGAHALHIAASHVAINIPITGAEPPGADPTERLLRVAALARELQSGAYPECEWVRRAPHLVIGFFASEPRYARENVSRVIAVFREFLLKNFDVSAVNTLASGVGYLITSRLPGIFGAGGDEPVARTDRFLLDLETARAADACKARSRAAAGGARGHRGRPAHGTRSACFACRRAIRVQRFRGKGREGIWTA
jgi:hypothetical protein